MTATTAAVPWRLLRPASWPIAAKLAVLLLVAGLLPMVAAAYYSLQGSLASVAATERRNLQQLAVTLAGRLDQLVNDTQHFLTYLSVHEVVQALVDDPVPARREWAEREMGKIAAANPDIDLMLILNAQGVAIAATRPQMVGRGFGFRDYYKEAIRGRNYISDIEVGSVTREPGVFFSAPILDAAGRTAGVAMLKLRGQAVVDILGRVRTSGNRYAFLVNGDGVVVYHPDSRLLYRSLMPLPPTVIDRIVQGRQFMTTRVDSLELPKLAAAMVNARAPGSVEYASPLSGQLEIAGFAPAQHRWVVGINEPEAVFAAPLRALFLDVVWAVVLIGAACVAVALWSTRQLLRPLRSLGAAVAAVHRGDYASARAVPYWDDELGDLARTFNDMVRSVQERERERDIFGRVVSPEVREKLLAGEVHLGGESLKVTVLFSDIRSFSTLSEQMSPEQVVQLLNEYLTAMTEAVKPWGGYINNFIGDAIVVIFGAPIAAPGREWAAVAAALDMRDRLAKLNTEREARGELPLDNGIGISTGEAVAGQIGSMDRFLYTVIGDAVNVAARLEALTKDFPDHPILINRATFDGIRDRPEAHITGLGLHPVKGRREPVEIYAVRRAN